ncbi:FxLYD domain-containing protein [Mycolicibacterium sp. HK-90]|uniref:FxLYD domain-containing protein n=1 Tax=Mycolicibacterium sp. HK-90 TaxID=3056937 RepID=UPI00265B039F|nr:FxLYD domain-containing protein [Mycolicibacterium sp. HK-90]WKG03622.1 FxLYD domain-containing protein [Mycolicibacterium sp. HK-90]
MTYPHEQWPSNSGSGLPPQPDNQPGYPGGPAPNYPGPGWPAQYPAYQPAAPRKSSTGLIVGLIIGAVVIALIVFVAPVVLFAKVSGDLNDTISESTGDKTEQILENELEVSFGEFVRTDTEYRESGKLPVTFRNKGGERATFYVQVEALDANGDRIAEDTASVTSLSPGQSTSEDLFTISDNVDDLEAATFRVASVSKY